MQVGEFRVAKAARSSRSSSSSLAGGKRLKSSGSTMTWHVEQAITPHTPLREARAQPRRCRAAFGPPRPQLPCECSVSLKKTYAKSRVQFLLGPRVLGNCVASLNDFLLGGISPETQSNRRACLPIIETKRFEHVARPPRSACTSRTKGKGNVPQIGNKPRSIKTFSSNIEIAWIAVR